jgi:hypothetical protein
MSSFINLTGPVNSRPRVWNPETQAVLLDGALISYFMTDANDATGYQDTIYF